MSSWKTIGGPPASRAIWLTTAARLPPALSPPTAIRDGSMPSSAAFAATHFVAAKLSLAAVGNRLSGAHR